MKSVVVIGEILVEIMADTRGQGFLDTQALTGPFASGAPAIFADQMARMGQSVAIISAVGNDDFGRMNLDKLSADGVDTTAVYIDQDRPTGTAFVRYRENGERDFVFNIRHSASGFLHDTPAVRDVLNNAEHLHVMGSSLSSPAFVALNLDTARAIHARGGTISFDPNLRKEILGTDGMEKALQEILTLTNVFLPSDKELTLLTEASNDHDAIAELQARGIDIVVHKQGLHGATLYHREGHLKQPAFVVDEIDPTGAGDCFGATFVSCWLGGMSMEKTLQLAAASGALAVTQRGPMSGTSDLATLTDFVACQQSDTTA